MARSISDRLKNAWEALIADPPEGNMTSEMPEGAVAQNLVNAWAALQPDPVQLQTPSGDTINWQPTIGEMDMKAPWARLEKVMAGANPLEMTPQQYMKHIRSLGPDSRIKAAELLGAQAIDQHGTPNLTELLQSRLRYDQIPQEQMPTLTISGEGPLTEGAYLPQTNAIELRSYPRDVLDGLTLPQHPEEYKAGVLGHEAFHARQNLNGEQEMYAPEISPPDRRTNSNLGWAGLFEPHRIEEYLRYAKENPGSIKLPYYVESALKKGASPYYLANMLQGDRDFLASIGQEYRIAKGNAGFRGTNPELTTMLEQANHFAPPVRTEAEIPVMYQAEQQARAGGDIGDAWMEKWPHLQDLRSEYESKLNQGTNFSPDQMDWKKAASMAWPFLAGGALGTGAGYIWDKYGNQQTPETQTEYKPDQNHSSVNQPLGPYNPVEGDPSLEDLPDTHRFMYMTRNRK